MNYEQFIFSMLECVREKLPETFLVEIQEILKNNGVIAVGLSVRKQEEPAAPIIYLEDYYEKYRMGAGVETLAEHLIRRSRYIPSVPVWDYKNILDFQKVRHQVVYKLINAKRNQKLLTEVPNLPMMDLAIVFYVLISVKEGENCSILIRNTHMNSWKLPISQLYQCAGENTKSLCPAMLRPLSDYVEIPKGEYLPESRLFILSNEMGFYGASAILYPRMPKKIYEALGGNYFLLPSSVHEFLAVRENHDVSPEHLKQIVRDVNKNHIAPEEYLSDEIYYFNGNIITKM